MNHRALAGLLAVSIVILTLAAPSPGIAQSILSPDGPGQNGQTRRQNFQTLVNDLYSRDFEPTHRILVNGKYLQAPPWYNSSTECGVSNLKNGFGVTAPSRDDYLLVSDELSELAIVTALADNDQRMMEIWNRLSIRASPAGSRR